MSAGISHLEPTSAKFERQTGHDAQAQRYRALQMVLVIALDAETAASCLGLSPEEASSFWPSELYQRLARAAHTDHAIGQRCDQYISQSLAAYIPNQASPAQHIEAFLAQRHLGSALDLAGLIWALVREQRPSLSPIIERLCAELQTLAASGLRAERCEPSKPPDPKYNFPKE